MVFLKEKKDWISESGYLINNSVDNQKFEVFVRQILKDKIDDLSIDRAITDDEKCNEIKIYVMGMIHGIRIFSDLDIITAGTMLEFVMPVTDKIYNCEEWEEIRKVGMSL